ncbi:MAG: TraR/DksA C4-type zinc finger protein [Pseudomonadota bacterium]
MALRKQGVRTEDSAPKPQPLHCEDCGEMIPEARRRAVPGCKRCLSCQTEFEQIHIHWRAL